MSWLFSQALVVAFSAEHCSAGEPFAQLNVMPTAQPFWRNAKPMDACRFSRFGLTLRVFDGRPWKGLVDVVSGGFPCQDISIAGCGDGLDGERSGLWREIARIVREVEPRYVFVENSPMLTSRGIHRILSDLAELRYDVEWGVLGADPGIRSLLEIEWCALLAERLAVEPRIREFLPVHARAVQCTLFAKTAESNWLVSLHQDLSIPVAERIESAACSGWSQKQGDIFVQPPASVLESILAVRLHLDDCDERNGGLRVVPGSHRLGRLSSDEAHREREIRGERLVSVPKGSVIVMRPLLLHASSISSVASPRRVLHFVYGPAALPEGLRWPPRKVVTVS